jgi:hypothetical protein
MNVAKSTLPNGVRFAPVETLENFNIGGGCIKRFSTRMFSLLFLLRAAAASRCVLQYALFSAAVTSTSHVV